MFSPTYLGDAIVVFRIQSFHFFYKSSKISIHHFKFFLWRRWWRYFWGVFREEWLQKETISKNKNLILRRLVHAQGLNSIDEWFRFCFGNICKQKRHPVCGRGKEESGAAQGNSVVPEKAWVRLSVQAKWNRLLCTVRFLVLIVCSLKCILALFQLILRIILILILMLHEALILSKFIKIRVKT